MKHLFSFITALCIIYSCNKDNDIPKDTTPYIGNPAAKVTKLSPEPTLKFILFETRKDSITLDVDNDKVNDIVFTADAIMGNTINWVYFYIRSNINTDSISVDNDTKVQLFNENDTVNAISRWYFFNYNYILCTRYRNYPNYILGTSGMWATSINQKYIGFKIANETIGWIKLSMDVDNDTVFTFTVHEYAMMDI